ncbi:hypothetical protein BJ138DRAFT_1110631 [Hygrophoropsis aurantiaca]|uniref:Uncharacterized protein n=1 Tax=Hygrophoropsis aurantiaca TaxID=72124 RepID=A0ACB8AMP4_9AGAM|nr:hypothetical protein BJ138DRAFT_1110631 [Hygrophoropsis aurantiaca]
MSLVMVVVVYLRVLGHSSPSFSDSSSTPRTPSPRSVDVLLSYKQPIDHVPSIYTDSPDTYDAQMMIQNDPWSAHADLYNPRASLLQELYDHDVPPQVHPDLYADEHAQYDWSHNQPMQVRQSMPDHTMVRRATFPYVRHDHIPQHSYYDGYPPQLYSEPMSTEPERHDPQSIKLEDSTPLIVPSQIGFPSHPLLHPHPHHPAYLSSPNAPGSVPIQHTDDAASKETQYLRRRCFNCHTTEPPSWRRSTLNPGKIVCNKCGLYERTHLRPRPLRFDELRAGGKRKTPGTADGKKPTKAVVGVAQIKKEPRDGSLMRRGSVSSTASSGGGASDWDDSGKEIVTFSHPVYLFAIAVSVYSSQPPTPGSSSNPPSNYNSPSVSTFPIPRSSQSPVSGDGSPAPPSEQGGIRLPNAPLTDIASLQQHHTPRKAATAPSYYPPQSFNSDMYQQQQYPMQQRRVQFSSPEMAPMHMQMSSPQIASPQIMSSPPSQLIAVPENISS